MLGFSLLIANCHRNHGSFINSDVNHSITTEKTGEAELLNAQRNLRLKKITYQRFCGPVCLRSVRDKKSTSSCARYTRSRLSDDHTAGIRWLPPTPYTSYTHSYWPHYKHNAPYKLVSTGKCSPIS